jgi:hypothetical protein
LQAQKNVERGYAAFFALVRSAQAPADAFLFFFQIKKKEETACLFIYFDQLSNAKERCSLRIHPLKSF